MANEGNLKPFTKDDPESVRKARECGSIGGTNSGKSKRKQKTIKQVADLIMSSVPVKTDAIKATLRAMGIDPNEDYDIGFLSTLSIANKATKTVKRWTNVINCSIIAVSKGGEQMNGEVEKKISEDHRDESLKGEINDY